MNKCLQTKEEVNSQMTIVKRSSEQSKNRKVFKKSQPLKDIPYSYDWSTEGAVTAVKDQLVCTGGGWAFAAVRYSSLYPEYYKNEMVFVCLFVFK